MGLENFKLFKSKKKKIVDSMYQQNILHKVFDKIWLEILRNHKGFYVYCTNKKLFGALNDVWLRTVKMCGNCKNENCFIYERFGYVFEELIKTNIHKSKSLWKVYLNLNEYGFKIEYS